MFVPEAGRFQSIYDVIRRIPRGRVATYGQIARLAGIPGHARLVGFAMAALPDGTRVPWHRVVNASGRCSPRGDAGRRVLRGDGVPGHVIQRLRLERERVRFDGDERIALERFRWRPRLDGVRQR
ncbi:MAG TPA: MGMT family protein [Thermoanaerobaculia bacterium]|jgi:methylated-DNA-protein-cysteine methyltransferase-like protein